MRNFYQKITTTLFLFCVGSTSLLAQDAKQMQIIRQETEINQLKTLESKLSKFHKQEKQKAEQVAKQKGWDIKGKRIDGGYFELMRIAEDGSPIYYTTYNVNASKSTRANTLNSGGILGLNLNGEGMYAHVWDGGHARVTHQEYDGSGGNNRVSKGDGYSSLSAHSGHVMGTILASGYKSQAKGMAPKAKGYTYDWNSDSSEAATAASNGMILSNHSYGYVSSSIPNQYFGAYISESRDWDNIMYNAPYYLMVVAAGNDGNNDTDNANPLNGYSAYDKLTGHSVSKNNLVVANLKDAQIDDQGNLISVERNSSSSEGPTDDYRIKPDISGNGTKVYSSTTSSNNAYGSMTGTSMASPNVTGSLLLLQQHYSNLNGNLMRAATLKGLALHTADDVASNGPDAETGWGLLNAKAAAETISQNGSKSLIKELTLNQGQIYTKTVTAAPGQKLMVSISWTDPAGQVVTATNSNTPVLVNDLDLLVKKNSTSYRPWRLTGVTTNGKGDNDVDPFERIDISNANGVYTITVRHEGSLHNGKQNFTLIVTGINAEDDSNDYCESKGKSIKDEYIQKVVVNTINNTSGHGNGYTDFTNLSTDLKRNTSYSISITPKWTGTIYAEGYGVWIDFNQDGDFSDANEKVFIKSPTKASSVSGTFTIPNGAVLGNTRMRVVMKYNATPTACEETFSYGEVEDYTVNIIENNEDEQAPSKPTNLSSSNITRSSLMLAWAASTDNVEVDYYKIYQNGVKVKTTVNEGIALTGLSSNTTYNYAVSAVDTSGNESLKSDQISVKTLAEVVYCESKGKSIRDEYIQKVVLNTINNTSGHGNGYTDFTNLSTDLKKNNSYSISITPKWTGTIYAEGYGVWIDFNQDGDFSDANEKVFSKSPTKASSVSGTFTIPNGAVLGNTRMRVVMKYNATPTACEETFSYGEVEDYTVNISANGSNSLNVNDVSVPVNTNNAEQIGLRVYPNPVKNGLVNVVSDEITEGTYEIIDISGRIVKSGLFNRGKIQINVEGINAGKYFVRISKDGRKAVKGLLIK